MTVYGYARCSTNETKQDVDRQARELRAAGAQEVILEYEHGDAKVKPMLDMLMEKIQAGDTIVTTEVSRLGRSVQQLCELINDVAEKRIRLIVPGSITVDCREGVLDPMTKAFLQMAGVFAELELNIIRARVKSGMANAKAKGAAIGRPRLTRDAIPASFYRYYPQYVSGDISMTEFSKLSGLARNTLYKYCGMFRKG